jgi:hypothetical protein
VINLEAISARLEKSKMKTLGFEPLVTSMLNFETVNFLVNTKADWQIIQ